MKLRLYCNRGSKGAMDLIRTLRSRGVDALRIKRNNSRYRWYPSHTIINWGATEMPRNQCTVFNSPESCRNSADKNVAFRILLGQGVQAVPHATDKLSAEQWIIEDDDVVFCRTLTQASQGRGIVVARVPEELVDAPLYTRYIESSREIRVHVFQGTVIDYAQKKRLNSESREERGVGTPDEWVRNHGNGWIFAREGVEVPSSALQVAVDAVAALGLDFGAVDMLVNPDMVLEVNSAPGLEGTTLERYADAFAEL